MNKISYLRMHNPRFYRPGLIEVEQWLVDETEAHRLQIFRGIGENQDGSDDEGDYTTDLISLRLIGAGPKPHALKRTYPDDKIWSSSLMEFL